MSLSRSRQPPEVGFDRDFVVAADWDDAAALQPEKALGVRRILTPGPLLQAVVAGRRIRLSRYHVQAGVVARDLRSRGR